MEFLRSQNCGLFWSSSFSFGKPFNRIHFDDILPYPILQLRPTAKNHTNCNKHKSGPQPTDIRNHLQTHHEAACQSEVCSISNQSGTEILPIEGKRWQNWFGKNDFWFFIHHCPDRFQGTHTKFSEYEPTAYYCFITGRILEECLKKKFPQGTSLHLSLLHFLTVDQVSKIRLAKTSIMMVNYSSSWWNGTFCSIIR